MYLVVLVWLVPLASQLGMTRDGWGHAGNKKKNIGSLIPRLETPGGMYSRRIHGEHLCQLRGGRRLAESNEYMNRHSPPPRPLHVTCASSSPHPYLSLRRRSIWSRSGLLYAPAAPLSPLPPPRAGGLLRIVFPARHLEDGASHIHGPQWPAAFVGRVDCRHDWFPALRI
jgi:hypothetical protein